MFYLWDEKMKIKLELTGDTNLKTQFDVMTALQKIFVGLDKINMMEIKGAE